MPSPVVCIAVLLAILTVSSHPTAFDWDTVEVVYAFGDSYSFVQGRRGHANFRYAMNPLFLSVCSFPVHSFIGDALNVAFTPHKLLTNEILPKNVCPRTCPGQDARH